MPLGSLIADAATEVGLIAGLIAVGGFLNHAAPALRDADEGVLRGATVRGGLGGLAVAAVVNLGALWLCNVLSSRSWSMSENQLFLALLAALFFVGSIIFIGIGLLGASDQLLGFLAVVILCVGSLVVAQVPPWYESRRRKR